jgi:hypothetical protein
MNYIEHKGTKYEIKEPTIESWTDIMKFKGILDEEELYLKMISSVTGLSSEEILNSNASTINLIGTTINNILNQTHKELKTKVELNGVTYVLVDINKISFGQFVDIDSFLKKDEDYRIKNLNELAAYLYCEEGINYKDSDFPKRIEAMKQLPMKYVEASLFFFLSLGKALSQLTTFYSQTKVGWEMMKLKVALASFGGGIKALIFSPKTKFGKLIMLLINPLLLALIICLTLWTLITRRKG